jgi:hypothetical protein
VIDKYIDERQKDGNSGRREEEQKDGRGILRLKGD